jgi:uncharacterized protein YndB with AHSA1/START domain
MMTNAVHAPDPATTFSIERTLDLAASPDRVWQALTESDEVAAWFPQRASLPTTVGEEGWMEWDGYPRSRLRIEALEPERYLAWNWSETSGESGADDPGTLVEWWLEPGVRGGTRLRLRESGLRTEQNRADNTGGWYSELRELRDHLATEPWQHPIHRRLELTADRSRVWRAMTDDAELHAWWGSQTPVVVEPGWEGWFDFPEHGRHAVRIEAVEPERYIAWRWSADQTDVALADAVQPLHVEWLLEDRAGGGTTLQLMESGFTGPAAHTDNTGGWDGEVLPNLVRLVGGEIAPA